VLVQKCERDGFSVIEKAPDSEIAGVYRKLAKSIMGKRAGKIPEPLDDKRLRNNENLIIEHFIKIWNRR